MTKSLAISAVIALVTCIGFYLFFRIHQELDIPPAIAGWLGLIAFLLSAIAATIYFRTRTER